MFSLRFDRFADFSKACLDNTGPVLGHVDTVSAARDMDILRAVLGDTQLHYLGYSYGTQLGATYASLFPQRVGRVVDTFFERTAIAASKAARPKQIRHAQLTGC